jgi:hypothetical protein
MTHHKGKDRLFQVDKNLRELIKKDTALWIPFSIALLHEK